MDWYQRGDEALEKAKAEDKPILLSIGYSSCYWCHVMAHESLWASVPFMGSASASPREGWERLFSVSSGGWNG